MLQKVTKIPARYYQFCLLNVGLIIALSKGMSLLAILSSLLMVVLAVAPFALMLGWLSPPHSLIHSEVSSKLMSYHDCVANFLKGWQEQSKEEKTKTITKTLVALYISLNFVCPCIENFLVVNGVFVFVFMQKELECVKSMIGKMCKGECPIPHCSKQ